MDPEETFTMDEQRLARMKELKESDYPLYPPKYVRTHRITEIREQFAGAGHDKSDEKVTTAGRLSTPRNHGKTVFCDLSDETGKIQLYIRKNDVGEEKFSFFSRYVERGDIIGVSGNLFMTKVGELTLWVDDLVLLSKAVCSLPEKFHGLKDVEKRYRQRYLDLIVNEESRQIFRTRSEIITSIRDFLNRRGFLEFETPILQPVYGGANARPFTTYHNFLDQNFFLRIAPELYLKRLIVGGFEKVYEIARNFRNEDVDTRHNPEFSMVEIYEAYSDYLDMMTLTEEMIAGIAKQVHSSFKVDFEGISLDFSPPWRRSSMADAVLEYTGIDVLNRTMDDLVSLAREKHLEGYEKASNVREMLVVFFEECVEKQLVQPTFIHDFPVENSPLAKRHRSREGFVERFELFVCGMELANGFSELNDPVDQRDRFLDQDEKRKHGDLEAQMIDNDFINALGYGMPPTGGVGIGIDRLVMLLTGNSSIKEVILFPSMRRENTGSGQEDRQV